MKKSIFSILLVISLMTALVSTAFVNPRNATLTGVKYVDGKGVVFKFDLKGTFETAEYSQAYIVVNHQVYALHCIYQGSLHKQDSVTCEAPGQIVQFHGYRAYGAFAGYPFISAIPKVTHTHPK